VHIDGLDVLVLYNNQRTSKLPVRTRLTQLHCEVFMSSPFPGMDPYLEGVRWPGFHHDLATEIKRQLLPRLLPRYYADTSTYFLVDTGEEVEITQNIYPDVGVMEGMPHSQVEIRDLQDHRLVTAIEFLSPTHKRGAGRKQYLRKRLHILRSTTHLIELDLLRHGRRLPWTRKLPPASYYVYLSRAETRTEIDIWHLGLPQALPEVPVPLLNGDPDVPLDLQMALTAVYDSSRYDLLLNYSEPSDIPLAPAQADWVDRWLKQKGCRPR
jgi:hypothetical protein